jgi:TolA-binding protein
MKKFLWVLAVAAGLPLVAACTKSVDRAQRDVQRARQEAVQDVRKEQHDLKETERDAAERIARQEQRVEDAARKGNEEIIKEQRELEDAKRAEARREAGDVPPIAPPIP